MTERNYFDIAETRKRAIEQVAEEDRKRTEEFHDYLNGLTDKKIKQQNEMQSLAGRAAGREIERAEKKRDAEIEAEKAQAIADIEAKYESQGVKSEETKQREAAWKSTLKNLRGLND